RLGWRLDRLACLLSRVNQTLFRARTAGALERYCTQYELSRRPLPARGILWFNSDHPMKSFAVPCAAGRG
ncbi:MAG TPA: hypothetical protein VFB37_00380, partial [Steroidobacteraceae bacterium]|nr:hypothetical protein [Steroidobacteraceae bacterium]